VIEGFLLNGVYVNGTWVAVDHRVQPAGPVFPYPAVTSFTVGDDAALRAEAALDVGTGMRNVTIGSRQRFFRSGMAASAVERALA
jgi:hypothetical protein